MLHFPARNTTRHHAQLVCSIFATKGQKSFNGYVPGPLLYRISYNEVFPRMVNVFSYYGKV